MIYIATAHCWAIFLSSLIISAAAIVALVAEGYKDTLAECVGLVLVAMAGIIVVLQIHAFGYAMGSGIAFLAVSVAVFAVANAWKNFGSFQRERRDHGHV